ncbi:GntR family transcriptional regulator [Rhodococcus sp. SBT000017]|nr:GntR family transcriptional regulator [Rhodococcus sp. SBT000017]
MVLRRRPQLSEDVAASIRQQIVTGALEPGAFVRIDETATELGVSATPVREALVSLRGEGLVELVPRRGYRVSELTQQDIDDIFWLQGTIAGTLARRAAHVITDEQIDAMRALNDRLRDAVFRCDLDGIESCEFAFHRYINKVAGGTKLAWFLLGAVRYTPARLYASNRQWCEHALSSHEELIEAFRRRDADGVADLMCMQFLVGATLVHGLHG